MNATAVEIDDLLKEYNAIKARSKLYYSDDDDEDDEDDEDVDLIEDLRIHTKSIQRIVHFLQNEPEQDKHQDEKHKNEKDDYEEEDRKHKICGIKNTNFIVASDDVKESNISTKPKKLTYIQPNYKKKAQKIKLLSSSKKKSVIKIKNLTTKQLKLPYSLHHRRKEQQTKRYRFWRGNESQLSIKEFLRGAKSIEFNTTSIAAFRDVMSEADLIKYGVLSVSVCVQCLQISIELFNSMWPNPMDKENLILLTKKEMIKRQIKNQLTLKQPIELFIEWGIDNLYVYPGHGKWIDAGEKIIGRVKYIANQRGWTFEETFIKIATQWNH